MELIRYNDIDDAWLNLPGIDSIEYSCPFIKAPPFFVDNPHLHVIELFKNPENIAYAVWILFGVRILPFQAVVLAELWNRPFPIFVATRGGSKTWTMALYCMLKALFMPDYKIVVVGSAFRQSKLVFAYCENFWKNGPVYRSLCTNTSGPKTSIDKCTFYINNSTITAIPVGPGGQKIRGLRANCIIADEFDAQDKDVFETVVAGFGAVSSSPSENVVKRMRNKKLASLDMEIPEDKQNSNQIIISGTAGYYFGPLYEYYKKYEAIIKSRGNDRILKDIFKGEIPDDFNWRDYSIIRIPYECLPEGFMDAKTISRAKATMNRAIFDMEYSAVFVEDSDGFFKRSIIEGCVANDKNVNSQNWVQWCPSTFEPQYEGDRNRRYVYGIDPASQQDNLAICILEVCDNHAKLAHMWTTNKDDFKDRQTSGYTKEIGYNAFVARKIRNLMRSFPPDVIGIDTQGGGYALMEALHDTNTLEDGEDPLWTLVDHDKPKDSDRYAGLHIIEEIQFANYEWLHGANFGLLKDMETKRLLFPRFDAVSIDLAIEQEKSRVIDFEAKNSKKVFLFDTMEDLFMEIEDLKDELTSIVVGIAGTGVAGRLRWSVPDVLLADNKKGRGRKDRYSALLIANSIARRLYSTKHKEVGYTCHGGLMQDFKKTGKEPMYTGPSWFTSNW